MLGTHTARYVREFSDSQHHTANWFTFANAFHRSRCVLAILCRPIACIWPPCTQVLLRRSAREPILDPERFSTGAGEGSIGVVTDRVWVAG